MRKLGMGMMRLPLLDPNDTALSFKNALNFQYP